MSTRGYAAEAAQLIDRLERLARSGEARHGVNPAQWEALRYLAQANRFSRTPAALADYLASTRGTVSQTLIALEGKGLVARRQSARDKRSVDLDLTDAGRRVLVDDPLQELARDLRKGDSDEGLAAAVEVLRDALRRALRRNGSRPFGVCHACRHFQKNASGRGRHHCALIDEPLSEEDSGLICTEQEPVPA
ncbi:MAG: MarR family transcriptional regulator [Alphaproteobacteria bacterium]|nr:MarR family transcriptional regulator [Alphaproteobacteria bacterium]